MRRVLADAESALLTSRSHDPDLGPGPEDERAAAHDTTTPDPVGTTIAHVISADGHLTTVQMGA